MQEVSYEKYLADINSKWQQKTYFPHRNKNYMPSYLAILAVL